MGFATYLVYTDALLLDLKFEYCGVFTTGGSTVEPDA